MTTPYTLTVNMKATDFFRCVATLLLMAGVLAGTARSVAAQNTGAVAGVVIDGDTGGPLPGANVTIQGTATGTATDLNGRYKIPGLDPGTYDIVFSFIGFQQKTVTGVEVQAGQTTNVDITLAPESEQLDEVIVTAEAARDSEAGLLRQRQKAAGVSDAISAEAIGRAGAGDAADAMSKVTGASVVDGKYVNVRGLQGRYVDTNLNGSSLPSTDPDGNSVALDIFPSNVIDNIVTTKTFTPDKSGDFTGGSVDITTKSLPEDLFFGVSVSSSFNSEVGLGGNIIRPVEGLNSIPAIAQNQDIPASLGQTFNNSEATQLLNNVTRAFVAPIAPIQESVVGNRGAELSFGNQYTVFGDKKLGVIASLSYDQSFSGYDNGVTARFEQTGLESETLNPTARYTSQNGVEETLMGGLLSLAFQPSPKHEIYTRFLANSDVAEEARFEQGRLPRDLTGDQVFQTRALRTTERTMLSGEVRGTHQFGEGRNTVRAEWTASYADATRDEPDHRFFSNQFSVENGGTDTSFSISKSIYLVPTRYFRELSEQDASGSFSVEVPVGAMTFKTGGNINSKTRTFRERRFEHLADQAEYTGNPNAYISEQAGIAGEDIFGRTRFGTYIIDRTQDSNNYDGRQDVLAGFAMAELPVPGVPGLEFIGGVRVEQTDMSIETLDGSRSGQFTTTDVLPSGNLVWSLQDNMNLRLAYGRTIARPTFREFAPFASFNFVGDYIEVGNPNLTRTRIHNVDLRWEWFMRGGEVLSVGTFYKSFDDPIERTINPTAAGSDTEINYVNKSSATVYGAEFEARKRLGGLADWLRHVQVGANLTLIQSEVDRSATELEAIRAFDENPSTTRQLQGQSPYIVTLNAGYENPNSGTSINMFFNRFGDRLDTVTRNGLDLFEQARSTVDITASQRLMNRFRVKASVKNALNADYVVSQAFSGESFVNDRYPLGRTISLGFSYSF
jgi:TonB-dependent receptor